MDNYSVFFPGYSAGEDAYKEIETVCSPYGTKAVVISDEISINATKKYLDEAINGTKINSIAILTSVLSSMASSSFFGPSIPL